MNPGVTILPEASMTRPPDGTATVVPTAAIFPARMTTVPFSMAGPAAVRMRALVIAIVGPAGTGFAGAGFCVAGFGAGFCSAGFREAAGGFAACDGFSTGTCAPMDNASTIVVIIGHLQRTASGR